MALPTRLVICVDGTQSVPLGSKQGVSQTSIHRIFLATRRGKCLDSTCGTTFNQEVQYFPGIGNAEDAFSKDRLQASVLGQGHLKQIEDVYESCCRLTSPNDEVWFFGFSRGAYVVRAVAGLLHNYGAVASAGQPEFAKDWKKLLKQAEATQGRSSLALSPVSAVISHLRIWLMQTLRLPPQPLEPPERPREYNSWALLILSKLSTNIHCSTLLLIGQSTTCDMLWLYTRSGKR